MNIWWIILIAVVAIFVLLKIFRKPVVLEGRVIEKNIGKNPVDDSFITIETSGKGKFVLKFETHSVGFLIHIGRRELFYNRADELDKAIALNDVVSVETFDKSGLTRGVYKLLSVFKTH